MKKFIIKIDRYILAQITVYIQAWIKRHDYKKHKVDFLIKTQYVNLGVIIFWATAMPVIYYLISGQIFNAFFHLAVWGALSVFDYTRIQFTIRDQKAWHDQLFSMRKNPIYYQMQKEVLEQLFEEGRRRRLTMSGFIVLITSSVVVALWLLSFLASSGSPAHFVSMYIVWNTLLGIFQTYLNYVFDFDEPTPKEKKAKASLTDLLLKLWNDLAGGFAPAPNYGV
jgi:hypothetical protein